MSEKLVLFGDLETTSLDPFDGSVLSSGFLVADADTLEIKDTYYAEYHPDLQMAIDMGSLHYAGVSLEEILGRDPNYTFREGIVELYEWIMTHFPNGNFTMMNWSLLFDNSFLFSAAQRYGVGIPLFGKESLCIRAFALGAGYYKVDRKTHEHKSYNMIELHTLLGGGEYVHHNALADAKAALYIYGVLSGKGLLE